MKIHRLPATLFALSVLLFPVLAAAQQYKGWQHSGALTILTTAEGAGLPAGATVEGFPLLVRLSGDWFDFKQAKAGGEDIRFSTSAGVALPYEIEEWDAAMGSASVWVPRGFHALWLW